MQKIIQLSTNKEKEVLDLTSLVASHIPDTTTGSVELFVQHTTAAASIADLDPGTDLDMLDAFYEMIPDLEYRHPHDPDHVPDHILATLIGPTVRVPTREGALALGQWQRIVLFEFDGPRERSCVISVRDYEEK